jgi:hypothetical protein
MYLCRFAESIQTCFGSVEIPLIPRAHSSRDGLNLCPISLSREIDPKPGSSRRPGALILGIRARALALSGIIHDFWELTQGGEMAEPSYEELKSRLAELEKQTGGRRTGELEFKVGEKGGVSVYGLGRFPVTLYYEQWIRLLDTGEKLRRFLEENKAKGTLKLKPK